MNEVATVDRRKFLGGSDIAAVLGLSPWRTPAALWDEKRRPPSDNPPGPDRGVLKRGKRWESVVAEMLVESLEAEGRKVEIVASNQRYVDPDYDFLACEIDFELRLDGADEITNCELKTVHPFKKRAWGESDSDNLPIYYTAQAMHGLGVTRRNTCLVAALFGADELRTYPVVRDDETIAWMRQEAVRFWTENVIAGVAPQPVEMRDLDVLYPKDSDAPALIADEALTSQLLCLRQVDREIKAREAEYQRLEFEIKRAMGDCTSLVVGRETKEAVTWKQRAYTYLDQAGLKEAHPKIHREFTRKGESRVFTLKNFSMDGVMPT